MRELLIEYDKIDQFDLNLASILVPDSDSKIFYLVLLLSRAVRSQHSCLPLESIDKDDPFNLALTEYGKKQSPFTSDDDFCALL